MSMLLPGQAHRPEIGRSGRGTGAAAEGPAADLRLRRWRSLRAAVAGLAWLVFGPAFAGPPESSRARLPAPGLVDTADLAAWLPRMNSASRDRNYQGTLVFSTAGVLSSMRVAHFCVGDNHYERSETLDGKMRRVYRHNDLVHTVWPQRGLVVVEPHGAPRQLPSTLQAVEPFALEQYALRLEGPDRVAGRPAQVLLLQPRDEWRLAQRLWADEATGLMLRADILSETGAVLESMAFSDLEVGIKAQPELVLQALRQIDGMKVLRPRAVLAQLETQGWQLSRPLPGFKVAHCVRRWHEVPPGVDAPATGNEVLQTVFGDGLTHITLFIEAFDSQRHRQGLGLRFGATHTLAERKGDYWITAMGDVPPSTLRRLVDALERRR